MRTVDITSMLRTGWFRVWVVAVLTLFAALAATAAYALWGQDFCYRYVSISTIDKMSPENTTLVAHLRKETESRTYCGDTQFSVLLTLEDLAKNGTVTQVGLQWQEPKGWSFDDLETLAILDSKEIRASLVLARIQQNAREAWLRSFVPWVVSLSVLSIGALLLGIGTAWVRRGFSPGAGQK